MPVAKRNYPRNHLTHFAYLWTRIPKTLSHSFKLPNPRLSVIFHHYILHILKHIEDGMPKIRKAIMIEMFFFFFLREKLSLLDGKY